MVEHSNLLIKKAFVLSEPKYEVAEVIKDTPIGGYYLVNASVTFTILAYGSKGLNIGECIDVVCWDKSILGKLLHINKGDVISLKGSLVKYKGDMFVRLVAFGEIN